MMGRRTVGPMRPSRHLPAPVVLLLLCAVGGAAALPRPTQAEMTLSVAPSLIELEAEEGASGSQTLTVGNDGDEPIEVTAGVEPYKGATGDRSAVDWLAVEPAGFRLEPGDRQAVTVAIELPDGDLASGGRYAAVSFTTGARTPDQTGMAMAGKLAVPFLIQVKGQGTLTREVDVPKLMPVLAPDGRVGFTALLRNEGNLHVVPEGVVTVTRGDGSPYASLEVPRTTAVLPGSEVLLAAKGTVPLEPGGQYRATMIVDVGPEEQTEASFAFTSEVALDIVGTAICENLDRGPTVRVELHNGGGLGLTPRVQASVRSEAGELIGTSPPGPPLLAWPAETTSVVLDLGERLLSGAYVLDLRVDITPQDAEGRVAVPPIEQEAVFQIGGLGEDAVPLCAASPGS